MRLSKKSKAILEFLFITDLNTLESLTHLRSGLYGSGNPSDERSFRRQLKAMESKGWITLGDENNGNDWIPRITQQGNDLINDDIDPKAEWANDWDGQWTSISFDIPAKARDQRWQLERWLGKRRFGRLQGSLWISHKANKDFSAELAERKIDPTSVVIIRGKFLSTQQAEEIVHTAWKFETINKNYRAYLDFLINNPAPDSANNNPPGALAQWLQQEFQAWRNAFESDPFLPNSLLPSNYLGKIAWNTRKETCQAAFNANSQ